MDPSSVILVKSDVEIVNIKAQYVFLEASPLMRTRSEIGE